MSYRGGGGGGGGGFVTRKAWDLTTNWVLLIGGVALLAGTAAAVAVALFIFHVLGMALGIGVTGAPEIGNAFHQGQSEMSKYMKAHGTKPTNATKNSTGLQPVPHP